MTREPDRDVIYALVYPEIPRDEITDDEFLSLTSPRVKIDSDECEWNTTIFVYVNAVDETDYVVVRERVIYDPRPEPLYVGNSAYLSFPPRFEYERLAEFSSATNQNLRDVMMFIASLIPEYDSTTT